jgi:hypothetical protein
VKEIKTMRELKDLIGLIWKSIKYIIVAAIIFMALWVAYKYLPEGKALLQLILNASGLAGAAAILGVFYNKTKNDVERPNVTASEEIPENFKNDLEEALKKTSAREALNNLVEVYKKHLGETSKNTDPINFSEYTCNPFDHKEKVFTLKPEELMFHGYDRECKDMFDELEKSHDYALFGSPLHFFNRILTAKYAFADPAAENKIGLDIYLCKNKIIEPDMEVYGYALISAYYNTEMFVSCWIVIKRNTRQIELCKARLDAKKRDSKESEPAVDHNKSHKESNP